MKNHENLSGQPVSRTRFEMGALKIQLRSAKHLADIQQMGMTKLTEPTGVPLNHLAANSPPSK